MDEMKKFFGMTEKPEQTLKMLVHLCHAKDWELANGDITNEERMSYYNDLVRYVKELST